MKKNKIIIILIIINIITIGIIYNFIKKDYLKNEKIIVKAMTEAEYENYITSLNQSHIDYVKHIQESKTKIASAITDMGVTTSSDDSPETMSSNIRSIVRNEGFKSLQLTTNVAQTVNLGYEPKRVMFFGSEGDNGFLFGVYDSYINRKDIIRVSMSNNLAYGGTGTYTSGSLTINDNGFTILLNSNAMSYLSDGMIYYVCE